MNKTVRRVSSLWILSLACVASGKVWADPNILWRIVHDKCMPAAQQGETASGCEVVDLRGYAVIKDICGPAQNLLIPTYRIAGMESVGAPWPDNLNLWAEAWKNRTYVSRNLDAPVPDDAIGLAINSMRSRSQDQLHIHIDCTKSEVRAQLGKHGDDVPGSWISEKILGHSYAITRIEAGKLQSTDPFNLVRQRAKALGQPIGDHTIFVTQEANGSFLVVDGFYQPDGPDINPGSAEELQDHWCTGMLRGPQALPEKELPNCRKPVP